MAGLAAGGEAQRQPRLLGDDDGAEGPAPATLRYNDPELGQGVFRPRQPLAPLRGDPLRSEPAAHFLVGGGEEDQVALEGNLGPLDGKHGHELKNARGLHVEGPAPVDEAVPQETAERVHRPVALVGIDHVDVVVEDEATERPVAEQPRHEVAALRRRLGRLARDSVPVEHLGEEARPRRLVARRIGRVDFEVSAHQLDGLAPQRPPVHHGRLSVPRFSTPRRSTPRLSTQYRPGFGRLARRRSSSAVARSSSPARSAASSRVS